jgi:cobyrinic acid a,c-diamide synthase
MTSPYPRIMIAGTGGDSGKTILSLGLLALWEEEGLERRAFKKGPDFIDAAWLGWAAGAPGRNLDTYMMAPDVVTRAFRRHGTAEGLNLIEGNRGLLDGVDPAGSHSSAALARLLECPVILVLSPLKMTATAAATVLGCRLLAPENEIAGVILNQVRGERHEGVVRAAVEEHAGIPVLGALPKLNGPTLVSRHLGLVPPAEHGPADHLREALLRQVRASLDVQKLVDIARRAAGLPAWTAAAAGDGRMATEGAKVRIGYFSDSAFTFYYPDNLEALHERGAELVPISALSDQRLPDLDSLYIGGGFPETHTRELAANHGLLAAVREAAGAGMPIYAECGGLMYLAETLEWHGKAVRLAGALPIRVGMHDRPQGHGYCRMTVDTPNPFFDVGTELKGHEFHYSDIVAGAAGVRTAFAVEKGRGCIGQRDAIIQDNILASYMHLHALGCPRWADGMIRAAQAYRDRKRAQGGPARSTVA